MKICTKCKKEKKDIMFWKNKSNKDGLCRQCKDCIKKYAKTPEQKKRNNQYTKNWWKNASPEVKERRIIRNRLYYQRIRNEVLQFYGNKCACCKEIEKEFLTLDHINNDGNKHRKKIGIKKGGDTKRLYEWARKNKYPKMLQILCFNCNIAKYKKGKCPHILK